MYWVRLQLGNVQLRPKLLPDRSPTTSFWDEEDFYAVKKDYPIYCLVSRIIFLPINRNNDLNLELAEKLKKYNR